MKCPICGRSLLPNSDRCPDCGYRCHAERPAPQPQPQPNTGRYTPPNPTKKSRGCCCCAIILLVPLILGLLAAIIGTTAYVLEEFDYSDFGFEFHAGTPFADEVPVTPPAESDEGCFSIQNGAVTFLPDYWAGGRVLTIPETVNGETVTAIAPGCFRGCDELTTILLPETVTSIGREAFAGCSELLGLYLPVGTENIDLRAFDGCINMESIYIPNTVTRIAPGCFDDCAALLYIFYDGNYDAWNELYSDYINPFTAAICHDGDYYHGAGG